MKNRIEHLSLSLSILFVTMFLIHPAIKQNGSLLMAFIVGTCVGYISHHIAEFLLKNQ